MSSKAPIPEMTGKAALRKRHAGKPPTDMLKAAVRKPKSEKAKK